VTGNAMREIKIDRNTTTLFISIPPSEEKIS